MAKDYKEEADAIAAGRGGWCLSDSVIGSDARNARARWKCENPHHRSWSASFERVRGYRKKPGTWCPKCAIERAAVARIRPFSDVQRMFAKANITILSTEKEYLNSDKIPFLTSLRVRCDICSYEWRTRVVYVLHGLGCRGCFALRSARAQRNSYQYVKSFLKDYGIALLWDKLKYEKEYKSAHETHLDCECRKCGHRWSPKFNAVRSRLQRGSGCPECGE